MTGETILVIDGGEEIDQRMTEALEAENYLVYPVSSQGVDAELAELLRPSLIYIKPLELSPTGLHPCKTIHAIPLLKKVPIVILASPKKALSPDTSRDYGIVDFLVPTFSSEELIQKTGAILGKAVSSRSPEEGEPAPASQTVRGMEKKRPAFLLPAIGFVILLNAVTSVTNLDITSMKEVLVNMSGGMGVKLFTTIAGLIAAIMLSLQYQLLDRGADDLVALMTKVIEVQVSPYIKAKAPA